MAASPDVAVYLDDYARHAVPPVNRLAADAAERACLRAAGTVVFQVTADEARALAEGTPTAGDLDGAPYEDEAQAAARRGYRILGGDPAELDGLIWGGSARMLLAFLAGTGTAGSAGGGRRRPRCPASWSVPEACGPG